MHDSGSVRMKSEVFLVSVPIGNPDDITIRAKNLLLKCDLLIGEEHKPTYRLLNHLGISKKYELLNEHSGREDLEELMTDILKQVENVKKTQIEINKHLSIIDHKQKKQP